MTSSLLISTLWRTIVSNSFDWLTRLFCSFPNHDTTLTVDTLKFEFCKQNAVVLEPKMEKTVYTGKNEGKIMDTEVSISFNKLPFTCVLPLFMDF